METMGEIHDPAHAGGSVHSTESDADQTRSEGRPCLMMVVRAGLAWPVWAPRARLFRSHASLLAAPRARSESLRSTAACNDANRPENKVACATSEPLFSRPSQRGPQVASTCSTFAGGVDHGRPVERLTASVVSTPPLCTVRAR